jgi:hypothetical protein
MNAELTRYDQKRDPPVGVKLPVKKWQVQSRWFPKEQSFIFSDANETKTIILPNCG